MSNGAGQIRADGPQCEPSLEVANNNGHSLRDTLTDVEAMIGRIEDFLSGARPEKESPGLAEGCPSGILAQICTQGAQNLDRLQDVHRRLDRMAGNLGVQK